ncbi:MAG: hypothetical protein J1F33_05450 [Clostridiales bacterium]|nr:hypothetical protein [Clostridiales bacterium]
MSKIVEIGYDTEVQVRRKVSGVKCLWKMGELDNGERCLILSTYNPAAKSGAVNQSLHITKKVAKQLIELFNRELLNN